jgi:hypothetical protein
MIYKFRILSGESEDFIREIEINRESNFLDLHIAIQQACAYDGMQMSSFFLCDEFWERGKEFTLFKMDLGEAADKEEMAEAKLFDHISAIKEKLIYLFDFFSERGFFIEMVDKLEAVTGITYPRCTISEGEAPVQLMIGDETEIATGYEDEWDDGLDELDDLGFENIDDIDLDNLGEY